MCIFLYDCSIYFSTYLIVHAGMGDMMIYCANLKFHLQIFGCLLHISDEACIIALQSPHFIHNHSLLFSERKYAIY